MNLNNFFLKEKNIFAKIFFTFFHKNMIIATLMNWFDMLTKPVKRHAFGYCCLNIKDIYTKENIIYFAFYASSKYLNISLIWQYLFQHFLREQWLIWASLF